MMIEPTVFVFTDIVGSRELRLRYGAKYQRDFDEHERILLGLLRAYGGAKVKFTGDGYFLTFIQPLAAIFWAVAVQIALWRTQWTMPVPLRIRIGLHFGTDAELMVRPGEPDDYVGEDVNFAQRVMSVANGGEIFASQKIYLETNVALTLPYAYAFRGVKTLKDGDAHPFWQLTHRDLSALPTEMGFVEENSVTRPPSNMKIPPHANFCGRDAAIQEIRTRLNTSSNPIVALCGMGGIGKTQLAAEYAHHYFDDYPGGVFWADVRDEGHLLTSYHEIAEHTIGQTLGLSAEQIAQRVRKELQRCGNPTLLIFDNIVEPALLRKWLPMTGGCHRLLTSQRQKFRDGIDRYPIPCLDEDDSLHLLTGEMPLGDDPQEEAAARAIVRLVGNLPLAVAQLAQHLGELQCSYVEYERRLSADMPGMLKRASKQFETGTDHEASIYATLELSVNGLQTKSPHAVSLLSAAACFAPNGIPAEVLWTACEGIDLDKFEDTVSDVQQSSLLMRELRKDGEPKRLTMHELVRSYAYVSLSPEVRKSVVSRVCAALARHFAQANRAMDWATVYHDMAHGVSAVKRAETVTSEERTPSRGITKSLIGILSEMTRFLVENRDYSLAQKYATQGLELSEKIYGKESQEYANLLRLQGELMLAQDDPDGTLEIGKRALEAVEKAWQTACTVLAPHAPERADYANSLGYVLKMQKEPLRALDCYHEALAIYKAQSANQQEKWNALKAMVLNNLGAALEALEKYSEAREYYQQSLDIQQHLGRNSLIPILLNNIGRVQGCEGLWNHALALHHDALARAMKIFPPFHPDICACHFYLGKALTGLGQPTRKALAQYRTALKGYQKPANAKNCGYQIGIVKAAIAKLNTDET